MIDGRENNEYADGRGDAPPEDTGKTEAPYEDGPDDVQPSPPRRMSTGVKVLIGCCVASVASACSLSLPDSSCRSSCGAEASIAQVDEDEKFQLDGDTLDYAWALKETSNTHTVQLAACAHHEGILIVLFTDSHIEFWELDDPEVEDRINEGTGLPRRLRTLGIRKCLVRVVARGRSNDALQLTCSLSKAL